MFVLVGSVGHTPLGAKSPAHFSYRFEHLLFQMQKKVLPPLCYILKKTIIT